MSTRLARALAAVSLPALLLPGPAPVRAASPVGHHVLSFGSGTPILLPTAFSKTLDQCEPDPDLGRLCSHVQSDLTLATDARGRITGFGSIDFSGTRGDNQLQGHFSGDASGSIQRGGARDAHVRLTFKLTGDMILSSGANQFALPTTVTGVLQGSVGDAGVFSGQEKLGFRIKRGPGPIALPFDASQQLDGDFGWGLVLDLVSAGPRGKLTGAAQATLGGGTVLQFGVSGLYDTRKDQSTLKLTPQGSARGASIRIEGLRAMGDPVQLTAGALQYKLAGQSGARSLGE